MNENKQATSIGWAYMLISMMLIVFALTLTGCRSQSNMTETVHTEYLIKEVRDTVMKERIIYIIDSTKQATTKTQRDCTVITQDANGNVIGTDRWHSTDTTRELSHEKTKVDSSAYYRSVIDSLRRIKKDSTNNTIYVEKDLSLWQKTKINFGGYAFVVVAAIIIYLTWYIKRRDRQNI